MNHAFETIQADMKNHVNAGFPLEAYGSSQAFAALVAHEIDPYSLDFSMGEIISAVLAKVCLEALAA